MKQSAFDHSEEENLWIVNSSKTGTLYGPPSGLLKKFLEKSWCKKSPIDLVIKYKEELLKYQKQRFHFWPRCSTLDQIYFLSLLNQKTG